MKEVYKSSYDVDPRVTEVMMITVTKSVDCVHLVALYEAFRGTPFSSELFGYFQSTIQKSEDKRKQAESELRLLREKADIR